MPEKLQNAFDANKNSFENYHYFAPSYRKSFLYWLNQVKRETTQQKRIAEIIKLCDSNIKSRDVR
ncbi:YdeI/OmpD-associated family protein [Winogradskyella bathintestinalis]|uniref:YdeI/OmpD-associated family protein n=1 Tax=Winogradskyella bathintestinalis TaxID=3035208 RepID=UPI0029622F38|nr:YdeI/OmpD-associated family protein [Winogradskyella bathintestinalis]